MFNNIDLPIEIGTKVLVNSKEKNKEIYGTIIEKDFGLYNILSFNPKNKLSFYLFAKPEDIVKTLSKSDIKEISDEDILYSIFGGNRISYRERIDIYRKKYEIAEIYKKKV